MRCSLSICPQAFVARATGKSAKERKKILKAFEAGALDTDSPGKPSRTVAVALDA